jgi:Fe-S-cluster containining protein
MQLVFLKQIVPSSVCLSCQVCCRFVGQESVFAPHLTSSDIDELLRAGLPPEVLKNLRFKLTAHNDVFLCPCFELSGNTCEFYQNRPLECRLYPFLVVRKAKKIFLALDKQCPYARQKQLENQPDYIESLVSFLESAPINKLILATPNLIGDYPADESLIYIRELNLANARD